MSSKSSDNKISNASNQKFESGLSSNLIYQGNEKIPFHERHPVYQNILREEFAYTVKKISKRKPILKKRFFTHLSF